MRHLACQENVFRRYFVLYNIYLMLSIEPVTVINHAYCSILKVHKKNERGETPLHVAARKGEHRLCRKLIEEGALINARDYAGWTPLHEACYHGHFKVAKLLLRYASFSL